MHSFSMKESNNSSDGDNCEYTNNNDDNAGDYDDINRKYWLKKKIKSVNFLERTNLILHFLNLLE